jgi:hypothetical protein
MQLQTKFHKPVYLFMLILILSLVLAAPFETFAGSQGEQYTFTSSSSGTSYGKDVEISGSISPAITGASVQIFAEDVTRAQSMEYLCPENDGNQFQNDETLPTSDDTYELEAVFMSPAGPLDTLVIPNDISITSGGTITSGSYDANSSGCSFTAQAGAGGVINVDASYNTEYGSSSTGSGITVSITDQPSGGGTVDDGINLTDNPYTAAIPTSSVDAGKSDTVTATFYIKDADGNEDTITAISQTVTISGGSTTVIIPPGGTTTTTPTTPPTPPATQIAAPDWSEKLASYLIAAPARWLMGVMGLYDPIDLVFGDYLINTTAVNTPAVSTITPATQSATTTGTSSQPQYSFTPVNDNGAITTFDTFTDKEWSTITNFYNAIGGMIPLELVLAVIFMGIIYWFQTINPESKVNLRSCIVGLFVAMVLLYMGGYMFSFIFDINKLIVGQFYSVIASNISGGTSFLTAFIGMAQDGYIGSAILFLFAIFSIGVLNWQYVLRKIMIALLIILLPVVAVVSIVKREVLGLWFKELMSNVFLQAAHAAVLAFLISLSLAYGATTGGPLATHQFWFSLVAIASLPVITSIIRRVFGLESYGGVAGGLTSALGIASLMNLGRMVGIGRGATSQGATSQGASSGATNSTADSSSGSSSGSVLGGVGRAVGKTITVAGALVGGMAFSTGGLVAGGALASVGAGLFGDTTSSMASFGGNVIGNIRSGEGIGLHKAAGMEDSSQLLDPVAMHQAGKNVFGDNILGKTAGTALAAGALVARPFARGQVGVLNQAKQSINSATKAIPALKANVANMADQKKMSTARYDHARALYSPDSEAMKKANATISSSSSDYGVGGLQGCKDYVAAHDRSVQATQGDIARHSEALENNPGSIDTSHQLAIAQNDHMALMKQSPRIEELRSATGHIDSARLDSGGKSMTLSDAKAHHESVTAQDSTAKISLMDAERALTKEGTRAIFEKIRKPN